MGVLFMVESNQCPRPGWLGASLCPEKMATEDCKLPDRQREFVEAYIGPARFNATKAAEMAGYKDPGQSGYELKKKPEIRARIDERLAEATLSANEVLAELTDVASAEWREFVEIKQDKLGRHLLVKMDLTNKVKSLELIGKHWKLFTDKTEHSGPDGAPLVANLTHAVLSNPAALDHVDGLLAALADGPGGAGVRPERGQVEAGPAPAPDQPEIGRGGCGDDAAPDR